MAHSYELVGVTAAPYAKAKAVPSSYPSVLDTRLFFSLTIALDGVTQGRTPKHYSNFGRRGHSHFGECGQRWASDIT
jgi:hypothetical protein